MKRGKKLLSSHSGRSFFVFVFWWGYLSDSLGGSIKEVNLSSKVGREWLGEGGGGVVISMFCAKFGRPGRLPPKGLTLFF